MADNAADGDGVVDGVKEGAADGAATYAALCNGCHSSYAPGLADIGWSAAHMRRQIRLGEDSMPPFGEDRIGAADLECLMAHLVTTGAVEGSAPAEPAPAEPAPAEPAPSDG